MWGYYFFEIFSISNTINVSNAIKNIPAVNSNIKFNCLNLKFKKVQIYDINLKINKLNI